MGAQYVTRACMGPIGVLANDPGRSATLSRRPLPPTRKYHPRPLKPKGPGVVRHWPLGIWRTFEGLGVRGKEYQAVEKVLPMPRKRVRARGGAPALLWVDSLRFFDAIVAPYLLPSHLRSTYVPIRRVLQQHRCVGRRCDRITAARPHVTAKGGSRLESSPQAIMTTLAERHVFYPSRASRTADLVTRSVAMGHALELAGVRFRPCGWLDTKYGCLALC
jgi:hypothetical protein